MFLFHDLSTTNTPIREANIATLESAGFTESGLPSRSGSLTLQEKKTKVTLVFGKKANVSGLGNKTKYFSLAKDFTTKQEAEAFAKTLNLKRK